MLRPHCIQCSAHRSRRCTVCARRRFGPPCEFRGARVLRRTIEQQIQLQLQHQQPSPGILSREASALSERGERGEAASPAAPRDEYYTTEEATVLAGLWVERRALEIGLSVRVTPSRDRDELLRQIDAEPGLLESLVRP